MQIDIDVKDEDEATDLMLHHLRVACALFECTHADKGLEANNRLNKMIMTDGWRNAISTFINMMDTAPEYNDE